METKEGTMRRRGWWRSPDWVREVDRASGLAEGEISFSIRQQSSKRVNRKTRQAMARLNMTDEDSVRRFHRAVGVGNVIGPVYPRNPTHRPYWYWATGSFEGTQAVIAMLWGGLGRRRRERAAEVLRGYHEAQRNRVRGPFR
jgi:hypothetical protein